MNKIKSVCVFILEQAPLLTVIAAMVGIGLSY